MSNGADAFKAFIKVDGVTGGATEASHKDWSEVSNFQFSIHVPEQMGSAGGGGTQVHGDVQFAPLSVTKKLDKASPDLFLGCCKGKAFKEVKVEQLKKTGSDSMVKIFALKLGNAVIIDYSPHGDEESLSFSCTRVDYEYASYGPDGKSLGSVTHYWDRATNKGG